MAKRSKRKDAEPDTPNEESFWDTWPESISRGRALFVAGISVRDRTVLETKRYNVVDVLSLPRSNNNEHQYAVEGWLQGMSEGSIPRDKEKRLSLELEARARGLLVHRSMKIDVQVKAGPKTLEDLLASRDTRFTLNRASPESIDRAVLAAVTPNADKEEN